MNISVVGTGYVGLVTGACLAKAGNNVYCVDINQEKIESLKNGIIPIYEEGLEAIVKENIENNRLHFTTQLSKVINNSDIVFSAVGTPPLEDGSSDLKYITEVAKEFGQLIKKHTIFVTKSTVPVGTAKKIKDIINSELKIRKENITFDIVSNPEFLKEGTAVDDFLNPERIIVGTNTEYAKNIMENLYKPFVSENPAKLVFTDIPSAEMIKYAANAMLATRISFMNEISNLCEKVGANVDLVRQGIGYDSRIGDKFLNAGCGYGGSCFPKDVKSLITTGRQNQCLMTIIEAVEKANQKQKMLLFNKVNLSLENNLFGKTIAIWGLSFKPNTDDMREAPSLLLIQNLIKAGANIKVYDPIVNINSLYIQKYKNNIEFCDDIYTTANNANAVVLVTEWDEFKTPNWEKIYNSLETKIIIDGRNIYNRQELEKLGFNYIAFGK